MLVAESSEGLSALPQPKSNSLQERFHECKAENTLLGKLLQESQSQHKSLEKQFQQERKKCAKATQALKDAELRAKDARSKADRGVIGATKINIQLHVVFRYSWGCISSNCLLSRGTFADVEKFNAATEELQKVRNTVTSQAASIRRQKERTEELEDVIIDLKHELDAAQAAKTTAEEAVAKAKTATSQKAVKLKAAEAAVAEARDELAQERSQQSAQSTAAQADIQSMLQTMQRQSDSALKAMEQAHRVELSNLHSRLEAVHAERDTLMADLRSAQEQLEAAHEDVKVARQEAEKHAQSSQSAMNSTIVVSGNVSRSTSPEAAASLQASVEELQQRNHRLQMALASKSRAAQPSKELLEEVRS